MLRQYINHKEMFWYILIGLIATLIDWGTFAIAVDQLHFHYQVALLLAFFLATTVHFIANKVVTFKSQTKQIRSQLFVYLVVVSISLLCSMGVLGFFIKVFSMNAVFARMLTTGIMLFPNYLLHKYISFSKKIFG